MQFSKYLKCFFIVPCLLILVGGFNWIFDPYDIFSPPKITGINDKPRHINTKRMVKAYGIMRIKPQAVCLGNSRAEMGIDPNHEGWAFKPSYNLAMSASNIYEMDKYFQFANKVQPLKQVLLTLDFFSFSTTPPVDAPDFDETRFSSIINRTGIFRFTGSDIIKTLFTMDALDSSIRVLQGANNSEYYLDDGRQVETPLVVVGQDGNHALFNGLVKAYVVTYNPDKYRFENLTAADPPFSYFRDILQTAYQNNIDLRMATSPCHARQWELLDIYGCWPQYEQWKRMLVSINEEEADKYHKSPFPLWDFSLYNEYTTEALPALGDTQNLMEWYFDSSHYLQKLGDLVLNRVLVEYDAGQIPIDNFGVLINSQNIEQDLEKNRSDRQIYRETHPNDIAEINQLFQEGIQERNRK